MSNNQKTDAQGAFNRLIQTLTDANEMTRNKASAVAILASAMFNVLTPEQQEKVLSSLESAFKQGPSAIAGVNAEIEAELSYFLHAYAMRRKLS
ncbi:hypothetical protein [Klebsiella michiganensis]|uniref:hypothetical protein n=1 Tax=Klebsiella michiganensis TaxID=1134687 RepID=UPI000664F0EE|nr:hypothetical protein [Klebsiella michiganensis]MBS0927828.1 hypothetical protein [Klebsiella michiganensis]